MVCEEDKRLGDSESGEEHYNMILGVGHATGGTPKRPRWPTNTPMQYV